MQRYFTPLHPTHSHHISEAPSPLPLRTRSKQDLQAYTLPAPRARGPEHSSTHGLSCCRCCLCSGLAWCRKTYSFLPRWTGCVGRRWWRWRGGGRDEVFGRGRCSLGVGWGRCRCRRRACLRLGEGNACGEEGQEEEWHFEKGVVGWEYDWGDMDGGGAMGLNTAY